MAANSADPHLAELLVDHSLDTLRWMRRKGVRFMPIDGRQSVDVGRIAGAAAAREALGDAGQLG